MGGAAQRARGRAARTFGSKSRTTCRARRASFTTSAAYDCASSSENAFDCRNMTPSASVITNPSTPPILEMLPGRKSKDGVVLCVCV